MSTRSTKGTRGCKNALFELLSIKIAPKLRLNQVLLEDSHWNRGDRWLLCWAAGWCHWVSHL